MLLHDLWKMNWIGYEIMYIFPHKPHKPNHCKIIYFFQYQSKFTLYIALAGLGIAYIFLSFEQMAVSVIKSSEVESHMTSVERVITYTKIENEPGYKVEQAPPENWPLEGNIQGGTKVALKDGQEPESHLLWQRYSVCQKLKVY